jgi:choline dehydrogenase-like flavoprotein
MAETTLDPGVARRRWDVIVVGTGMGGGTLGHRLAAQGRSVLFCERGAAPLMADPLGDNGYPELTLHPPGRVPSPGDRALLDRHGRCADPLVDVTGARPRSFVPFIGQGLGGSSALYGMALERFWPVDFEPASGTAGTGGAAAVERWPLRYDDLLPHYRAAERLYQVRGDVDPLRALKGLPADEPLPGAPALPAADEALRRWLEARGLHPYALPSACAYAPGCGTCQGHRCARACKRDAASVCVEPALRAHDAALLPGCRVVAVRTDGRRAIGVACETSQGPLNLQADTVVLAAGALQTPLILERSALAQGSGALGRYLMRHYIDLYLVRPEPSSAGEPFDNRRKALAFNDFYATDEGKLGTVQSFGRLPPVSMLLGSLEDDLRASPWRPLAPLLPLLRPALRPMLDDWVHGWHVLATIVEDLPHADHWVRPLDGRGEGAQLRYRMTDEGRRRVAAMRRRMATLLRGRRWRRLDQAANNQRIAHVCGTCRFGDNPACSVLDRHNRVHDLDNLFVVDSSFFPSSGGTNPSLTIAANALRVADLIHTGALA